MPVKAAAVHFPEISLTLVRRVSARLPINNYLFRTDPSCTKLEIKEYLQKLYGVKVARIATSISQGKVRRAPGKRSLLYKLKTYKKVYVRIADAADAAAPGLQ